MNNNNRSSYINDEDQDRSKLNSLFLYANNPAQYQTNELPKSFRECDLPESFFRQPTKNNDYHHTKNQLSLPSISSPSSHLTRTIHNNNQHSRNVSDTAVLNGQNSMESQVNSQSSVLPLPDGWTEKLTDDGQIYYVDHITKYTTWTDPRPSHYAAFQSFCTTLPLPDDYRQLCDLQGNVYFINDKHQQTDWDDPRPNYYRSMMTKRLDISTTKPLPIVPQSSEDPLKNKFLEILTEQHTLQLRTQELERMAIDIRKMLNQQSNINNQSIKTESLFDDLLHHKRQDSDDSGLDEGQHSFTPIPNVLSFAADNHFPNPADEGILPVNMGFSTQNSHQNSQLNNKFIKQPHQWSYHTNM